MLSILDSRPDRNCAGLARREFLRIGALGMGGLTLPQLMAARAHAGASAAGGYVHDRAVVLLFLQGGPSHIEFFDPKMTAPVEIRSITGEVATKIPGVTFGGTFSRLASLTDHFSIVRSYGSQNAAHTYLNVVSAGNPLKAAMSAIYARVAGANSPATGMPSNVLVKPEAVQDGLTLGVNFDATELPTLVSPGGLGPACEAFDPSGGGDLRANLQLTLSAERFTDRRALLGQLDQLRREADRSRAFEAVDRFQQQALDVLVRGVASAFDLSREEPATLARYDTSHYFDLHEITRWADMRRASNLLGRQMLLARRLVEAGCGFVTVSDGGWDMHANANSPKHMTALAPMSRQVDHAVAAFLEDVAERGLSDKILLVVTGEMGRSPRLNKDGGRDHHPYLTPLLLAGGGVKRGVILGQSDRYATVPAGDGYTPKQLLGTVMHTLFDVGRLRLDSSLPSELPRFLEQCPPIEPLMA